MIPYGECECVCGKAKEYHNWYCATCFNNCECCNVRNGLVKKLMWQIEYEGKNFVVILLQTGKYEAFILNHCPQYMDLVNTYRLLRS